MQRSDEEIWCERGDSNPHGFPRQILSLVRLPIPPLSHASISTSYQFITLPRRDSGRHFPLPSLTDCYVIFASEEHLQFYFNTCPERVMRCSVLTLCPVSISFAAFGLYSGNLR